jgi:hypothetical protein
MVENLKELKNENPEIFEEKYQLVKDYPVFKKSAENKEKMEYREDFLIK